jgi:hypothetical protein
MAITLWVLEETLLIDKRTFLLYHDQLGLNQEKVLRGNKANRFSHLHPLIKT